MTGWLEISTDGFASFNSSRKPGHLVKELVQNAFDAIGDQPGKVHLNFQYDGHEFIVECRDTGEGMIDLEAIRVVYLTFKKDSHLKRGRFGRGFKEILSIASWAIVESGSNGLHFTVEDEKQEVRPVMLHPPITGTVVRMALPFGEETVNELDTYFGSFLVPQHIGFYLNGRKLSPREPKHVVEVSLTTEVYHGESHSWRKPKRATQIELVPTRRDEDAMIYEMGIPVAVAEWAVRFHANVLQRVPMNPNRDALASGYAQKVHAASLPLLLSDLDETEVTQDWVGSAGVACDPAVQKQIVTKAFGPEAVRAVPTMGKRDYNDDAERVGAVIVKTQQMSSGFREMAKGHLPSAKEKVEEVQTKLVEAVAQSGFSLNDFGAEAETKLSWITKRGGEAEVERCLSFAVWFCQRLVDACGPGHQPVTGALALGRIPKLLVVEIGQFLAHWSSDNKLTLALECDCFWNDPLGAKALSIYVHEAAHAQNMHHGKSFHGEVERLAGVGAAAMFTHADEIRARWPDLVERSAHESGSVVENVTQKSLGWWGRLKNG